MKRLLLFLVMVTVICFSVATTNAANFEYHGRTEGVITAYATGRVGNNFIQLNKSTTISYINNLDEYLPTIQKSFKDKRIVEIVISGKTDSGFPLIQIESMVLK